MNETRDPRLEALFADAERDLTDDGFTQRVMGGVRRRDRNVLFGRLGIVLVLVALEVLPSSPLSGSIASFAGRLSVTLIPLDNEWLAFAAAPLHSVLRSRRRLRGHGVEDPQAQVRVIIPPHAPKTIGRRRVGGAQQVHLLVGLDLVQLRQRHRLQRPTCIQQQRRRRHHRSGELR